MLTLRHRVYSSFGFDINYRRGFLLSFLVGFAVRLIPELLAHPYPIGYDTVRYVAVTKNGMVWAHWTSVFSTWLLYAILKGLYGLSQVDPLFLVKMIAPVLYALNASGIYFFAKQALDWNVQKSLIVAVFFVFQLAAFRISWDLLSNTLGMALVLFALPFVMKLASKRDFVVFVLLSMLVVFGHELASVVMLTVVIFGLALKDLLARNKEKLLKVSAAILPAMVAFFTSVYLRAFPLQLEAKTNILSAVQPIVRPGGLFFLTNYFGGSLSGSYVSYFDLASSVFSVFSVLYLLSLPLVLVGFFRNRVLDAWTSFLTFASFGCLAVPFLALDVWERWLFLLVYPLTFYASHGLFNVLKSVNGAARPGFRWLGWMKVSKVTTVGLLAGMLLLTALYVGTTVQSDNYVAFSIPTISRYFSVAPTVPLQDVMGTTKAMEWLNVNMGDGSCVLVHPAFLSWARLYLDDKHVIILYSDGVNEALNVATDHDLSPVYLIWWRESIGWYWFSVPGCFRPVFESGRMAVFEW